MKRTKNSPSTPTNTTLTESLLASDVCAINNDSDFDQNLNQSTTRKLSKNLDGNGTKISSPTEHVYQVDKTNPNSNDHNRDEDIEEQQANAIQAKLTTALGHNKSMFFILLLLVLGTLALIVTIFVVAVVFTLRNKRRVPSSNDESVHFIVLGDWGRQGQYNQTSVAHQMTQWCKSKGKCDFVMNVGDNFYKDGVTSVDDPLWKLSYENIYDSKELKQCKWYSVLGNHDIRLSPQSQIDYTKYSDRWYMPSPFYDVLYEGVNDIRMHMIFTDTAPFVSGYYTNDQVNQTFLNENKPSKTQQLSWLNTKLGQSSNNDVHWKFVIGHHPVYSAGSSHGDTVELIEQFAPLFDLHEADAYFSGHDHSLQLLEDTSQVDGQKPKKTSYVVSGAGSKTDPTVDHPKLVFGYGESGFIGVTLTKRTMAMEFVNHSGNNVRTSKFEK